MDEETIIKWGSRIFLIVLVVGVIWWILKRRKKYEYSGIKSYKADSFITRFFRHFQIKKPIRRRRYNKTEEMCRKIIQDLFNKKFPSVRPDFLKSPMTKKNLELDCYCEELKIALEYNGKQHYTYMPYFHKSKRDFFSQVHRDDWKRKRCKELGIHLIEIPYWVAPIDLKDYIVKELKKKNLL